MQSYQIKMKNSNETKFGTENPKIVISKVEKPQMKGRRRKKRQNDKLSNEADNCYLG